VKKNTTILVILQLVFLCSSATVFGSDANLLHSGRVESSHIKFYGDGSEKPNRFKFSTTDGVEFVMYSNEVLLAPKGALIEVHLSPIQTRGRLLACAFDLKSARIVSNGVESDLLFEEPMHFQTGLGEGCN